MMKSYSETSIGSPFKEVNVLKNILIQLGQRSDDTIKASAVVSCDGLVKAQLLGEIEPNRFSAMCASLLSLAKRATNDAVCGELKLTLLEGTLGTMIVIQIGTKAVLAVIAKPNAKLGRLFIEVRKTAETLEEHL